MDYTDLQTWFSDVVGGLVTHPKEISIVQTQDEEGLLFVLKVHENDRGKVIGKKGNIANALRTVLRASGYLFDVRVSMKVDVPGSNFTPKQLED